MNPDRQALLEQSIARYRKQLETQRPDDNATLEQMEDVVEKIGQAILPDLQEKLVPQRTKTPRDNQIACPCGAKARYRGQSTRTLVTRHGLLPWRRPTYYCSKRQKATAPLDATLGLDRGETTLPVRHWVATLPPHLGFVTTAQVLRQLRGIALCAATVERIAVRVGTSLRQEQPTEAQLHHQDRLPDRRTACPRRLSIGADGLMTPLREAWKKDKRLAVCRRKI